MNFKLGSAIFKYFLTIALFLSITIALGFDESSIEGNQAFGIATNLIGAVVPAVDFFRRISAHPATFATLYAINWLFVPVYLGGMYLARPVWQLDNVKMFVRRLRRQRPGTSVGMTMFFCAIFCLLFVLCDLSVLHGPGPYSMNMNPAIIARSALFKLIDKSSFVTALFSWGYCLLGAVCYYVVTMYIAFLYFSLGDNAASE